MAATTTLSLSRSADVAGLLTPSKLRNIRSSLYFTRYQRQVTLVGRASSIGTHPQRERIEQAIAAGETGHP